MWLPLFFSLMVVGISGQVSEEFIDVNLYNLPEDLSVVIEQGTVVGSHSNSRTFAEFYGIP